MRWDGWKGIIIEDYYYTIKDAEFLLYGSFVLCDDNNYIHINNNNEDTYRMIFKVKIFWIHYVCYMFTIIRNCLFILLFSSFSLLNDVDLLSIFEWIYCRMILSCTKASARMGIVHLCSKNKGWKNIDRGVSKGFGCQNTPFMEIFEKKPKTPT